MILDFEFYMYNSCYLCGIGPNQDKGNLDTFSYLRKLGLCNYEYNTIDLFVSLYAKLLGNYFGQ